MSRRASRSRWIWIVVLVLAAGGCPREAAPPETGPDGGITTGSGLTDMSSPDSAAGQAGNDAPPDDGNASNGADGSGDAGGANQPDDSGDAGDGDGTTDSGEDDAGAPPPTRPIETTANSIAVSSGGPRTDPEGSAPPATDTTLVTWRDARGAPRTLTLGAYLYQYDFTFDDNLQVVTRSANDDAYGHPGFGYVVSHNSANGNSPLGKRNVPTSMQTTVFQGGHHALHRVELVYDRDKEGGGMGIRIPVVIEWFVATGRDHPVWSVTWRLSDMENPQNVNLNAYRMDTRGPYGSLNFDGAPTRNAGDAIGGIAWGDCGYAFTTLGDADLNLNSAWTYDTPNDVNFVRAWTTSANAEMGIVQTRVGDCSMGYGDRVVGRERGGTSLTNYLNKGDCTAAGDGRVYALPCISGWPYQMMNYDWDPGTGKPAGEATGTKLLAWGSPYGWLGASAFDLFDYSGTADGRGDRSYATFIVLGPKFRYDPVSGIPDQDGDVALVLREVAALNAATISDISGGGAAEGYLDMFAAFALRAGSAGVQFTLVPAVGLPVHDPVFVVSGFPVTQRPIIRVDGSEISVNTGAADSGAFVSLERGTQRLWVTLNRTLATAARIEIVP